ncbi:hypothetical protein SO802_029186 [Lithocarpus litseifolius]|uniref:Reverse transcriptase zinc-binding domain-containing protein n=1 Tax=Lithocarpus litseifolius TaxID=425828 RepID=A0AAW2BSY6_9ROSI
MCKSKLRGASIVLDIPLSHNLPEDKVIWVGNKKGNFTIKSAYYIAFNVLETNETGESSKGDPRLPLWRKLWHLKIPAKIRIFAWRACMNALPTKLNLSKRGVNTNVSCPICDEEIETTSHPLISCKYARQVWDNWSENPVNISINNNDILDVAMRIVAEGTTHDLETFFLTTWSIWYIRNQKVFKDSCHLSTQVWNFSRRLSHDFKEASNTFCDKQSLLKEGWSPPPLGMYKVNVDGTTSNDGRPSSIGVIIRNSKGEITAALCMPLSGEYSSLETEAIAVEK